MNLEKAQKRQQLCDTIGTFNKWEVPTADQGNQFLTGLEANVWPTGGGPVITEKKVVQLLCDSKNDEDYNIVGFSLCSSSVWSWCLHKSFGVKETLLHWRDFDRQAEGGQNQRSRPKREYRRVSFSAIYTNCNLWLQEISSGSTVCRENGENLQVVLQLIAVFPPYLQNQNESSLRSF